LGSGEFLYFLFILGIIPIYANNNYTLTVTKSLWKSVIEHGILSIKEPITFKGDDAMRKLEYTFKTDTLFKMLFVQYPELLKKLVADLLGIPLEGIGHSAVGM